MSILKEEELFMQAILKKIQKEQSGMSIIEILAAVTFSIVTLGALITLGIVTSRSSDAARKRSQAVEFAKQGVEAVRAIRDNVSEFQGQEFAVCGESCSPACAGWDWVLINACPWSNGTSNMTFFLGSSSDKWNLQYVNDGGDDLHTSYQIPADTNFYRKVIVVEGPSADGSDKEIEVRISWKVREQVFTVSERILLTDWR
ncbi:MAG: hypothetical protein UR87_C0062G0006 [candidate division CPR3 bacterium GW2011_GWE2_35_7]|uniref:Uncharacterized protein n=1 Tax=candidate division CPR3 bacterium GW2011_GWF2_35_18 TaxID=1618350 RepID=A0A0G0ERH8_UNCC3|nr:MAG: hypothetical protein UR67_C0002G0077 [candidate division CPR3 bacterium GW2011_GWF2_35_18]KKP84951.1 MAG: hypothetical protein UR87_C0062G0006 [candidate division CPR3 bacterium GW2011_GWE2_35_7]